MTTIDVRPGEPASTVTFDAHPDTYRHWTLSVDGTVAALTLDVAEDGGIRPGYTLKLNSYDLGVDIELRDALDRIRFEHPAVGVVVVTSGKERVFCSGANIYMLGLSSHAWKVNFCKFTNETRNGMEDSSHSTGLRFLAACNGATAGGGYELALACDEIVMVDDRSSTVSLPEVSLLGVIPGTGGLTRLTDKRKVRRDLADVLCTTPDGVRAARALEWGLVDAIARPQEFDHVVAGRALALAGTSDRPIDATGIPLTPLKRSIDDDGYSYEFVEVRFDRGTRSAAITVRGPDSREVDIAGAVARGCAWWPLQAARELDDAILLLRTNEPATGTWVLRARCDPASVLASDAFMAAHASHWFVREVIGLWRRTLARLEVSSHSLFAVADRGASFAGTLLELALAADRTYVLAGAGDAGGVLTFSEQNFGAYPSLNGLARVEARFYRDHAAVANLHAAIGEPLDATRALELGLATATFDELDWQTEIRLALEERASLSADALTALEANLRFGEPESMPARIFGRLSAWQNWVFTRPNASGESGALTVYGTGRKPAFELERT